MADCIEGESMFVWETRAEVCPSKVHILSDMLSLSFI